MTKLRLLLQVLLQEVLQRLTTLLSENLHPVAKSGCTAGAFHDKTCTSMQKLPRMLKVLERRRRVIQVREP